MVRLRLFLAPDRTEGQVITLSYTLRVANRVKAAGFNSLADLLRAGIRGVRDSGVGDSVRVMIHIDKGGSLDTSQCSFENIMARNVEFDLIGLSYYPFWHGKGVFYWAPEWIMGSRWNGPDWSHHWEQRALFDSAGNARPGMRAFRPSAR